MGKNNIKNFLLIIISLSLTKEIIAKIRPIIKNKNPTL